MISGIILSLAAAMLSVLAFCLARWPMGWLKLWSPWRAFLARPYLSCGETRLLTSIRVRATLAGIALLVVAIILPVTGTAFFRLPSSSWGAPRVDPAPPTRLPLLIPGNHAPD